MAQTKRNNLLPDLFIPSTEFSGTQNAHNVAILPIEQSWLRPFMSEVQRHPGQTDSPAAHAHIGKKMPRRLMAQSVSTLSKTSQVTIWHIRTRTTNNAAPGYCVSINITTSCSLPMNVLIKILQRVHSLSFAFKEQET